MLVSLYLSRTLMAQWFDPRHEQLVLSKHIIELRLELDSLENEVRKKDQFVRNLQGILMGEPGLIQEAAEKPSVSAAEESNEKVSLNEIDSQFRKEFEQQSEFTFVSGNHSYLQEFEETFFFSPVSGIVSKPFDISTNHFGIDIVAKDNEPVKAIADGTVIFSDWSQESGNVIAIQHRGNIISVYKHNSALLKKVGNFVFSGDVISIIGNSGELTTGPHLHMELWFNGNPVDPEEFITF